MVHAGRLTHSRRNDFQTFTVIITVCTSPRTLSSLRGFVPQTEVLFDPLALKVILWFVSVFLVNEIIPNYEVGCLLWTGAIVCGKPALHKKSYPSWLLVMNLKSVFVDFGWTVCSVNWYVNFGCIYVHILSPCKQVTYRVNYSKFSLSHWTLPSNST